MIKARHYLLALLALMITPIIWAGFNVFARVTFKEIMSDWFEHVKSDEPWGFFDGGRDVY